jgi:hypothetical protein
MQLEGACCPFHSVESGELEISYSVSCKGRSKTYKILLSLSLVPTNAIPKAIVDVSY